jgi:LuxR family maltose regulon positive regulatory protein
MPILGAKLHVPVPRHELVLRPRLTDRMRFGDGQAPRFVLIAAPAGFGKTTLMIQLLMAAGSKGRADPAGRPMPAWLSLDPADVDVRRFLLHVVAAVRATAPEVGTEALAFLAAEGSAPVEDVLVSLVNDLEILAGPTVLVLDDYHVVDDAPIHDAVRFLLDNLPPQVTLAMTTRAEPPLPLGRLRARGELLEIRAADLRFTADEATSFLNDIMGLQLDAARVTALESRTEGWVAGLQLAALSARSTVDSAVGDGDRFIEEFTGSHRFVLDYLVEEVLDKQSEDVRTFLLETAVLDQLSGPLCDALTGRQDGRRMLELLERADLFVVPLDDQRCWWRYHHLFADALRARLDGNEPDKARQLHRRAARWYTEAGLLTDARAHAVAGGDSEQVADLVELALPGLRARREDHALRDYLCAVPEATVRRRSLLATHYAWIPLSRGELDQADAWLDAAVAVSDEPRPDAYAGASGPLADLVHARDEARRELPAMVAMYRASIAQARGDIAGTTTQARRMLELATDTDHMTRAAGSAFLGLAAWAAGDVSAAVVTFGQAARSMHEAGSTADELGATVVLAGMWVANGRLDLARQLCVDAIDTAGRHAGPQLTTAADLHVSLAGVLREQGDLAAAEEQLAAARELGDRASLPENRYRWYTTMAGVLTARGDLDGAVAMLHEAGPLYQPGFFPDVEPISAQLARTRIRQGRTADAREWATRNRTTLHGEPDFLAEYNVLTLVRLVLAEHRDADEAVPRAAVDDAVEALDRVLATADTVGRGGSLLDAQLLRALAAHAIQDVDSALEQFRLALRLGAAAGYRRRFLDEGAPALELLQAVAGRPDWPEAALARDVLRAAGSDAATAPSMALPGSRGDAAAGSVERLSERELEVLGLLATELTGPEIARRLYVSVNTLRTHTKHIFTKLDVNTRRAAVRRAAELGLL